MNESSAESVRVCTSLFQGERRGLSPTSALQLEVVNIEVEEARDLNRLWHSVLPIFQTGFKLNAMACFGAKFDELFYAVGIWRLPSARLLPQDGTWLELVRYAIADDAPKNTGSRIDAVMTRLISKQFPIVETLVSYQSLADHDGTIYKAGGWFNDGLCKGSSWDRPNRSRPDNNAATGDKIRWLKNLKKFCNLRRSIPQKRSESTPSLIETS